MSEEERRIMWDLAFVLTGARTRNKLVLVKQTKQTNHSCTMAPSFRFMYCVRYTEGE